MARAIRILFVSGRIPLAINRIPFVSRSYPAEKVARWRCRRLEGPARAGARSPRSPANRTSRTSGHGAEPRRRDLLADRNGQADGVAPKAWLRHVLTHIADRPVNRVDDFLPWNCNLPATL